VDLGRPVLPQKIFRFPFTPNQIYKPRHPAPWRGIGQRHERRCRMRWTRRVRKTNAPDADGKAVWSRCPDAGIKLVEAIPPATVARKPGHRGERGISRKPSRRESRIASAGPVCSCAFFSHFGTRDRGCSAPGFSCALFFQRVAIDSKLGRHAPRECGCVAHASTSLRAGRPPTGAYPTLPSTISRNTRLTSAWVSLTRASSDEKSGASPARAITRNRPSPAVSGLNPSLTHSRRIWVRS
jgi:hypothetical protein